MLCTITTKKKITINGQKKITGRKKPKNVLGASVQRILETQMEIFETENHSLFPLKFSLHCALNIECTRQTKYYSNLQLVKV